MKKYDFILLETLYWNRSHYTFDIENLAKILISTGLKVAVVNYLNNDTYHINKGYDLINIYPDEKFPDRQSLFDERSKLIRFYKKIRIDWDRNKFFKYIFDNIKDLSENFYLGSYTEEAAIDLINGSSYVTAVINLMFHRRDQDKSQAIKILGAGQQYLVAIVKDMNGKYWYFPQLQLTATGEGSGVTRADGSKYSVTLNQALP